jgi:hypothetical protein
LVPLVLLVVIPLEKGDLRFVLDSGLPEGGRRAEDENVVVLTVEAGVARLEAVRKVLDLKGINPY